jgi:hypothetical protein
MKIIFFLIFSKFLRFEFHVLFLYYVTLHLLCSINMKKYKRIFACLRVRMYTCVGMYACMFEYTSVHTHTHTHTRTHTEPLLAAVPNLLLI